MPRDACPICGTPSTADFKPFCSRGCKDRDLLQWLGEGYRVPGEPAETNVHSGLDSHEFPD
ncbi:DNA gyrase inhibitor YacG [Sphingomonas pituitosa]|uniref:DNA gyrase inhibitor YacG n=1 Tax=Sphingomonas pituitosa TaxID=99597 RepID=UPI00082C3D51|nr:DNA gyrase inhibitor YacG [Sphingomonas pituitosa]